MQINGQFNAPALLILRKSPDTRCIGGSVGPRAGLGALVKRGWPTKGVGINEVGNIQEFYTIRKQIFIL
jgi:hypothetical protein